MPSQRREFVNFLGLHTSSQRFGTVATMVLVLAPCLCGRAASPSPLQPIEPVADDPFWQEYREPFVAWGHEVKNSRVALCFDSSGVLWTTGPWGVRRPLCQS